MKNFIICLLSFMLLSFVAVETKAQVVAMTNPNGLVLDTATQAAAEGATIQVKQYQATVAIQVTTTKISGTIAGSIKWLGSNDGLTWVELQSDTLVDATRTYGYTESPKKWLYYKHLITQTGTSSMSYKGLVYTTRVN